MAMPRDLYHQIGGLDVTWPMCGEDRDLCARWRGHGYRHDLRAEAPSWGTRTTSTCAGSGSSISTTAAARAASARPAPSAATGLRRRLSGPFYLGLPLAAFRYVPGPRALLVAPLLVLSQISNIAGFVREWMRPSDLAPTWQVEELP